jgi:hypothetical protein
MMLPRLTLGNDFVNRPAISLSSLRLASQRVKIILTAIPLNVSWLCVAVTKSTKSVGYAHLRR